MIEGSQSTELLKEKRMKTTQENKNINWTECDFGIDDDGKLKLEIEITDKDIPTEVQLMIAANCLASIIAQNGLNPVEVFSTATREGKQ